MNNMTREGQIMPDAYRRSPAFCSAPTEEQTAPPVIGSLPKLTADTKAVLPLMGQYAEVDTYTLQTRALAHARRARVPQLFPVEAKHISRALAVAILHGVAKA